MSLRFRFPPNKSLFNRISLRPFFFLSVLAAWLK